MDKIPLTLEGIEALRKEAKKRLTSMTPQLIASPYEDLMREILFKGIPKLDRTGTGTVSLFGKQIRFDLSRGFPLVTTKKVYTKAIIYELLWFLQGNTNIQYLCKNGVRIWDDWPYEIYKKSSEFGGEDIKAFAEKIAADDAFAERWGDLGPVYGKQWRSWEGVGGQTIDQIVNLINQIKKNPDSRRLIVSAWNVALIEEMALPPCHCLFQFYVAEGKLSCQLYQRSADVFLGVPFNIASYALLIMMIAQVCELGLGEFVHTFGDVHLYANHFDQVVTQLSRNPLLDPTMELNPDVKDIFGFKFEDFMLKNYYPHPAITASVAV